MGRVFLNDQSKCDVAAIYIHPGVSKARIQQFLSDALASHTPSAGVDIAIPLIVTGDFNVNIDDDRWLIELFQRDFGLTYIPSPYSTTLGNTTLDLTFTRDIGATCVPYVSYFSYHRPLFNKIKLIE